MKIKIKRNFKFSAGFKRFLISLPITICILFIFLNKVNADIPSVPSNLVSCTCVTSAGQTCVTTEQVPGTNFSYGMLLGSDIHIYSPCVNGIYTVYHAYTGAVTVSNFLDQIPNSQVVNGNNDTINAPKNYHFSTVLNDWELQNLFSNTYFNVQCGLYIFGFVPNCIPSGYYTFMSTALGNDSGVPCTRANNILGTLHATGDVSYGYTPNVISFGGGDGGGFGNSNSYVVSDNVFNFATNFSCY